MKGWLLGVSTLGALLCAPFATHASDPSCIDRVVAVVDREVLTQTEWLAEARMALAWRSADLAMAEELPPSFLEHFLDYAIGQMLIAREARRLSDIEPSKEAVLKRLQAFKANFSTLKDYQSFVSLLGMDDDYVHSTLVRDLRHQRALQRRLAPYFQDDKTHMERDKDGLDGRMQTALRAWLKELRQTAQIACVNGEGALQRQNDS